MKNMKDAKRYVGLVHTLVSPVMELYSVRFSLQGCIFVFTGLITM